MAVKKVKSDVSLFQKLLHTPAEMPGCSGREGGFTGLTFTQGGKAGGDVTLFTGCLGCEGHKPAHAPELDRLGGKVKWQGVVHVNDTAFRKPYAQKGKLMIQPVRETLALQAVSGI